MRTFLASQAAEMICPKMFTESGDHICCREVQCMAWQWADHPTEAVTTIPGARPNGLGWRKGGMRDGMRLWFRNRCDSERRGYCGAFTTDRNSFQIHDPYMKVRALLPSECIKDPTHERGDSLKETA